MRLEAPVLWHFALRGKEGPWRAAIKKLWGEMKTTDKLLLHHLVATCSRVSRVAAKLVHSILVDAVVLMQDVDRTHWVPSLTYALILLRPRPGARYR